MKKVIYTTLFWLVLLAGFVFYVKFFNENLATSLSNFLVSNPEIVASNKLRREFNEKFDSLLDGFGSLESMISVYIEQKEEDFVLTGEQEYRTVSLYYFNELEDAKLPASQQASVASVLPLVRQIKDSKSIIEDTIRLLISGELSEREISQGFTTEFPHPDFRLLRSELEGGVLTLYFTQVAGFTSGGSARISILAQSIIRTAMQFDEVQEVVFMPEEIFQP